jgi:phosphoglycolate phosphatase
MFPRNPQVIALDLDGTLIDSRRDIANAANVALSEHGLPALPLDVISSFVGDGAANLVDRACGPAASSAQRAAVLHSFFRIYTRDAVVHTTCYAGVVDGLGRLNGLAAANGFPKLALCTNKPRAMTDRVLDLMDLRKHFAITVAADDLPEKKPHPAQLQWVSAQLGVTPENIVMVGDGPQDIECGRRAGTTTVGVTYGIKDPSEMRAAGPDYVIDHFDELLQLVHRA